MVVFPLTQHSLTGRRDAFAPSATALFLPDQRFRSGIGSAVTRTRSYISIADIGA
jgi:hypothetical protein